MQTRRDLLMYLGMLPAVSLLGCGGSNENLATRLRYWGTATLDVGNKNWRQAESEAKVIVDFTDNGNDLGPVLARMIGGTARGDYDIGGVQGGAEPEMFAADAIIPWDLEKIPSWSKVWPWVKSIPYLSRAGSQIGLPVVVNADSMIYRESATGPIDSYYAVFDPARKGRTSMEDSWMNSVIFTAIYMKENNVEGLSKIQDPGDLEEAELHTVIEFLKKKKMDGQFYKFWSGWTDGLDLITSKRVDVMTGWEPIVYAAQKAGHTDVKYAEPKEGYEGWSNNLVLHSGVLNSEERYEAAHRFAEWQLSGAYGCMLGALRGYMVPTGSCVELLGQGDRQYYDSSTGKMETVGKARALELESHVKSKFQSKKGRIYWQNARPRNYGLYERLWAELRAT